jgi:hypothetical protein
MQWFTSGRFINLGEEVFHFYRDENEVSKSTPRHVYPPLLVMFPNMASCDYKNYGTAGGIQETTSLCNLPHSFLFRGILVGTWVVMATLLVICSAQLIWTSISFILPSIKR